MTGIVTWAKERFDGAAVFSTLLLYFMIAVPTRAISHFDFLVSWIDIFGALLLVSFFLLLRIFDEHKDYSEDLVLHPERVLSRGIVTLPTLKKLGGFCLAVQILITFILSPTQTWGFYFLSLGWALLMLVEFFVRDWLRKQVFFYVLTHMFIASLVSAWIMSFIGMSYERICQLWPLLMLPFVMGFLYELCRKSFGLDEDQRIESYLNIFGSKKLIGLLGILSALGFLLSYKIFDLLGNASLSFVTLLSYFLIAAGWQKYFKDPTLKNRKASQGATGLAILLIYGSIIFYAWYVHGKTS